MASPSDILYARDLAEDLWRRGELSEGFRLLKSVWPEARKAEGHTTLFVGSMLNIICQDLGEPDRARSYILPLRPVAAAIGDAHLLGKFENSLAVTNKLLRRYDEALEGYTAAGWYYERAQEWQKRADVEANIGNLYLAMELPEAAEPHLENALRGCDDPLSAGQVLETRARMLQALGRYEEAVRVAEESVRLLKSLEGEQRALDESLLTYGRITFEAKHTKARTR